jgi:hypothetical protein
MIATKFFRSSRFTGSGNLQPSPSHATNLTLEQRAGRHGLPGRAFASARVRGEDLLNGRRV